MVTLTSVDPMPGAAINPGAHQPQSGGEAVVGEDARLGFKPGWPGMRPDGASGCRVGGCPGGDVQAFEAMDAPSGCPPFL